MTDYHFQQIQQGKRAAQLGIISNTLLVIAKVLAGILGNSYALIADGVESGADVFFSLIVWRGLHIAGKEANEDYHFGYGKAEPLSAAIVSLMLLGASVAVCILAIREILTPHHLPAPFTLIVLAGVIFIKEFLFRKVFNVGEHLESVSVKSDAWHHRADAITSLAAFIGITIALIGGPGWEQADDYAALVCSAVIAWNGISMLRSAAAELMDKAPSDEMIKQVIATATTVEDVKAVEKVLARKSGLSYFIAMHVQADANMTLHDAHIVGGKVKSAVKREFPAVKDVLVHMEPFEHE